jgi:hypothetical protein
VTTSAGQVVERTYRVSVSDGQLNLRLADLGGSGWWAMINGLDIIFAGADETGPRVVAAKPAGTATGPIDRFTLTFDEPVDEGSLTLADVAVLEGPAGPIAPMAINHLGGGQVEVEFSPQNTAGVYRLVVGPNITDGAGNLMDQDGDGTGGEALEDQFEAIFTLEAGPAYVGRFDFGTTTSPVAENYTRVTRYDSYSVAVGYGWHLGSVADISRSTGTDLTRDVNFTHDATFSLDVANGEYDVLATLGDTSLAHDLVGVFLEGIQRDTVTTSAGQVVERTYRVSVSDRQLNLRLADLGGSDWWAMINGLEVIAVGGEGGGGGGGGQSATSAMALAVDRAMEAHLHIAFGKLSPRIRSALPVMRSLDAASINLLAIETLRAKRPAEDDGSRSATKQELTSHGSKNAGFDGDDRLEGLMSLAAAL